MGMLKLVLASQSPRRKELLEKAGFSPLVLPVKLSETPDKNLSLNDQILKIARDKGLACLEEYKYLKNGNYLVLSADTVVCVDDSFLGKPENHEQARQFLTQLSGRSHEVKTAVFLSNCKKNQQVEWLVTTKVYFRNLTSTEIENYIQTDEPFDKAGGYGIQGLAGAFVEKIEGSFSNVVGLPVETVVEKIKELNWAIL